MDAADLVVEQEGKMSAGRRADPLQGVNIELQYKYIKAGVSSLDLRIQKLIINRYELGV